MRDSKLVQNHDVSAVVCVFCGAATYAVQEFKYISDNVRLLQVADIRAMEEIIPKLKTLNTSDR